MNRNHDNVIVFVNDFIPKVICANIMKSSSGIKTVEAERSSKVDLTSAHVIEGGHEGRLNDRSSLTKVTFRLSLHTSNTHN